MINFHKRNLKAMTLVEILVVLTIIAIIAAITIVVINPEKQKNRARDAVLINTLSSIGQNFDTFFGLYGYYPKPADSDKLIALFPLNSFTINSTATTFIISKAGVFVGGVASGDMIYRTGDFSNPLDGVEEACIEGASNEDPSKYIAWGPGHSVKVINNTCASTAGYAELTGL